MYVVAVFNGLLLNVVQKNFHDILGLCAVDSALMVVVCVSVDALVERGGTEEEAGISGPSDGAGDRGDSSALPDQAPAHLGCHRGQETAAEELSRHSQPLKAVITSEV